MSCHLLGVLEPPVVLQINRDASRTPSVTSDRGEKTRCLARFRIEPGHCTGLALVRSRLSQLN